MRWFDAPYRMLTVAVLTWLLMLVSGWWWLLLFALPTSFYVGYLIANQPEIIIAPRAALANLRGVNFTEYNNLSEALKHYDRAIELRSSFAMARLNRGLLHMESGNHDAALTDFDIALKHSPSLGEAFAARGQIRLKQGDESGALADWLHAEQNGSKLVYTLRGGYQLDRGKHRDALNDFEEALRLQPDNAITLNNAAFITALIGDAEQARKLANQAIKLNPGQAFSYTTRGIASYRLNEHSTALSDFLKAGEFERDFPLAIAGQMLSYAGMGKFDETSRIKAYLISLRADYGTVAFYVHHYALTGEFLNRLDEILA